MKRASILLAAWMSLGLAVVVLPRVARAQSAAVQQNISDGDRYYDQGNFKKAGAYYDSAIRAEPRGVKPAVYAKRATIFLIDKKYPEGLAWITGTAEATYPNDPAIMEQKAIFLLKTNKRDEAVVVATEVVKRNPAAFSNQLILGDYYYNGGESTADKTIESYEAYLKNRSAELAGGDGLILVKLGFTYLSLENYVEAEKRFDLALGKPGKNTNVVPNARKGLCAAYSAQEKWDRAITLCEQVIKDRKNMDATPYLNIGRAYLARNKLDDAMGAANSFIGLQPKKASGYLLRGKIFSKQNKLNDAEGQFNKASELEPNDATVARELGRVYLAQKQPKKAIAKLEKVPNPDPDVLEDLARAYLADDQAGKAATTAEKAIEGTAKDEPKVLASRVTLAADAYYNGAELGKSKAKYEQALMLNSTSASAKAGLVDTMNRQAFEQFGKGNMAGAEKLLLEAYAIDPGSVRTNYNLGLIALENKRYPDAIKYLSVRLQKQPDDLLSNRLIAKAYLNSGNEAKAIEHYVKAEAEGKRQRANPILAEIYTEWAPIILKAGKIDDAADKLEVASQYALGRPFENATKRNLQIALFRRGLDRWKKGQRGEAVADLEGATREPKLLQGVEEDTFTYALGIAYLSVGQEAKAQPIFQKFKGKGTLTFLKAPFDKIGGDFFPALVLYREGSAKGRLAAADVFDKLATRTTGKLQDKLKELVRSTYEAAAYDDYVKGNEKGSATWLAKASKAGGGRKVDHNQAVINFKGKGADATFKAFGGDPPEALVNYGILIDQGGKNPKAAYEAYVAGRAKGAKSAQLDDWIDSKQKIFGYN